jgi:hypothetical protein
MTAGIDVLLRPERDAVPRSKRRLGSRAKWDVTLAVTGFVYIGLILWLSLDTPLVSALIVLLAVHQLCWRKTEKSV